MDAFADHYPSRVAPEPCVAERQDPVVHPSVEDAVEAGPLARDQLAGFERDGFLFFERFLPESEITALNADMAALRPDERSVGKECFSTCRSRGWPDH